MGLLGNLKTTAAWAGSHGASRFSRAARLGKRAKVTRAAQKIPGTASMPNPPRVPRSAREQAAYLDRKRRGYGASRYLGGRGQGRAEAATRRSTFGSAYNTQGVLTNPRTGRPGVNYNPSMGTYRATSPKAINQKGASGFSHGKKLRYGAVGVGAVGVAWGLMQRNHSTDKTGYSQSRGIRNY